MKRAALLLLTLTVARFLPAEEAPPVAIQFATHGYAEYTPGDLPIVLAAPHGGHLQPESIPDRVAGVRDSDANTQELARTIGEVFQERVGARPHVIIAHLHRSKLDPNREIGEAAGGHPDAEKAWQEYHAFIEKARAAAIARFGVAFLIDLHGHGHPGQRVELGYLHHTEELAHDDAAMNLPLVAQAGSLALIAARERQPYAELLRGAASLGALLETEGFRATPSPSAPHPIAPYFRGGYTIARHCLADEMTTGLQIECFRVGLRDTAENRLAFAHALVTSLEKFLPAQLDLTLGTPREVAAKPQPTPEAASQ